MKTNQYKQYGKTGSAAYAEKLKDPRWQRKRLEIMQRDEFRCLDCGAAENTLHVHHCVYQNGKEPWECESGYLRTLCEECHEERHTLEHDVKLEFSMLLAQLTSDDLRLMFDEIIEAKGGDAINGVTIACMSKLEHYSEIRWWIHACENPEFRDSYCAVTGKDPKAMSWPPYPTTP